MSSSKYLHDIIDMPFAGLSLCECVEYTYLDFGYWSCFLEFLGRISCYIDIMIVNYLPIVLCCCKK